MIRAALARRLYDGLVRRATPLPAEFLDAPCLVVSPHPDDETLGCGGLLALKRERGVPVSVVYMTDGSGSHPGFADQRALAGRRRDEALAACATLGIAEGDVHFLEVPDGTLAAAAASAVTRLAPLLDAHDRALLVLPHPDEPPSDHAATYHVTAQCLQARGRRARALLYPVWLWDQWPFTNPFSPPRGRSSVRSIVRTAARHRFGTGLRRTLDHRVDIGPVLARKRAALAAHTTQTVAPPDAPDWPVLADVAHGEWLDHLMRPTELYGLTTLGAHDDTTEPAPAGAGRRGKEPHAH